MRHKKIQSSKQRKKLKPVDPFNKTKGANDARNNPKINAAPKASDIDEQPTPKSQREFQRRLEEFRSEEKSPKVEKKRKRSNKKPKFDEFGNEMIEGYTKGPWESEGRFYARVCRETDHYIQEQQLKIKYDLTGGVTDKELELEGSDKKRKRKKNKMANKLSLKEKNLMLTGNASGVAKNSADNLWKTNETANSADSTNKRNNKSRKKKRKRKEKIDLMNEKDFVAFGERVDAPPDFIGAPRTALKAASAQAGKKDLLLKSILTKESDKLKNEQSNKSNEDKTLKLIGDPKREALLREERKRVIDLYRASKRSK